MGTFTFDQGGDAEMTATLFNRRADIIDNVFKGSATLKAFKDFGGIDLQDGGQGIVQPVIASRNNTGESFSGFDTFSVSPQDNETSLKFPWSSVRVHVAVAWDEKKRNKGKNQLINLVNMKTDTAMMSLKDLINTQLSQAQPGSSSKDVTSLTEILDSVPSAAPPRGTDVIGGIDPASAAWWRNPTNVSGAAFDLTALRTVFHSASDGSDPVTFMLTNQGGYEAYEDSQVGQIRYSSGPSIDAGASDLLFKKTPIRWDANFTQVGSEDPWYGINTKYHKICFHPDAQFVTTPFVPAMNGTYEVAQILVMMQQTINNRRRGFFYSHT